MSSPIATAGSSDAEMGRAAADYELLQTFLSSIGVELTPHKCREVGTYSWIADAQPGDHIAVRSVTKSKLDVIWHHGIYLGEKKLAHMHPRGNISEVSVDGFMADIPQKDTYVDKVVIVEYSGDTEFARGIAVKIAKLTKLSKLEDPLMQRLTYNVLTANCESFAVFCRTGRYDMPLVELLHGIPVAESCSSNRLARTRKFH